ncbi:hypothetical protein SNE510_22630 [Streptomyces sp. NE5-10]|uniref:Uncharacterized protein n=1 Tax=Streptomyces hydrogenans TaxID=1873719 RepID=A0ABQ3PEN7_9ACTN|nr:hypothetical protein GCM10018784_38790 [Streptomyces hydrogenans]GHI23471.1 hypothetical protein Shyd_48420 [Streptomyces hydrogenans]GHJ92744.1 hypothetical protein SNE510_22630 [Streptomyces sp. NE5-10]
MEVREAEVGHVVTHPFMLSARRGCGNPYSGAGVAQDTYETVSFRWEEGYLRTVRRVRNRFVRSGGTAWPAAD